LQDPSALDAIVIEPGDVLMTRDGTQVVTDPDTGDSIIVSEGTGGKVDVYTYGTKLQEILESFIYVDKSNTGSAANSINDYVIGQIASDYGKTITKKRLDNIKSGIYPNQPVNNLVEVSGSVSGSNFTEKSVDFYGRVSGNYELLKDDGDYAGSVWGFDKLSWISDQISDLSEDKTKSTYNGQDPLTYTDILRISNCKQRINVVNENSTVNRTNRYSIQLSHKPITNVTRVFNVTTGERYIVSNRNYDGNSSDLNTTGRIQISGKNLPSISHILQVDYEWQYSHDPFVDFDSFYINDNPRTAIDVVDWGYNNAIRREEQIVNDGYQITVEHNISTVISVNKVTTDYGLTITYSASDQNIILENLSELITNIVSIRRVSDNAELFNTKNKDGTFNNTTVILPSDTLGITGDIVNITYNATDLFTVNNITGNTSNNIIRYNGNAINNIFNYTGSFYWVVLSFVA
jgi:hypothetical protein